MNHTNEHENVLRIFRGISRIVLIPLLGKAAIPMFLLS
jgi:hypothetical protein